jgi:hypothetical protein
MPGSEWSIQKQTDRRLDPYRQQFSKKVVAKRDMLLLMGKDEDDLRKLVLAVIFLLQTKPWRLEVDLFKSFINVDLDFLRTLDPAWIR